MATDVLARLSVLIDAQTKQFGTALNGLNTQLNKFGATVNAQATRCHSSNGWWLRSRQRLASQFGRAGSTQSALSICTALAPASSA